MSKENLQLVHSGGEKTRLRDRLSPKNKARAATGFIWWQHAQTVGGAAMLFTPAAPLGVGILALNAVQYPVAYKYRANRRKEAGLPPLKGRLFGRNKGAHQEVHHSPNVVRLDARRPQPTAHHTLFKRAA